MYYIISKDFIKLMLTKMKKNAIIFLLLFLVSCWKQETEIIQKIENNTLTNKTKIVSNKSTTQNQDISNETEIKINEANLYFKNKDYKNAQESYEEILKKWISNAEILDNLFVSYINNMEYDKAWNIILMFINTIWAKEEFVWSFIEEWNLSNNIVTISKELEIDWYKNQNLMIEYAKHLYQAGDYYYELDQQKYFFAIMLHYLSAYWALEKAQELNESNSEIYYYKWRLIMDIWSPYKYAIEQLEKAIEIKNDDFNYYYRLWNAYMHDKQFELAKQNFLKWLDLNNKYEKLYLNLWNVYFALWTKNKWYEAYNNWLKICEEKCDWFNNNIWLELYNEWKYSQAKIYFEKAIELNPDYTTAKSYIEKINALINQ